MRILFFTWRSVLRRFVGVVGELTAEGHEVVVMSPSHKARALPRPLAKHPGVRLVSYDEISDAGFGRAIATLRQTRDYAWYLSPQQRVASFSRRHALDRLVKVATAGALGADPAWRDPVLELDTDDLLAVGDALAQLERRIPPDPGIVELIRAERADLVLVSPLVKQNFQQTEIVKAAHSLGVPIGFPVYSWDNLSNKGRVHVSPDRTFVWNEVQRREAIDLHGLDPGSIVVTGAPHWDAFFNLQPSSGRDDFCRAHGFDPSRPIVLYLGSTVRICPDETLVLDRWIQAVRKAPGRLREANILFRPHPDRPQSESRFWPADGRMSVSPHPRRNDQSLFDELHHAAAVVGLNTTAQIEASILGKPVYTFPAGDLAPGQEGTLHFYYLLEEHGGVVSFAETLDEHVSRLERGVSGDYDREAIRRFCETFIRPHGLDRPVAPILARELLALSGSAQTARSAGRGADAVSANR
jgi:hypothetical protein